MLMNDARFSSVSEHAGRWSAARQREESPERIRRITDALVAEGARGVLEEARGTRMPVFAAGKIDDAELPYSWGTPRRPQGAPFKLRLGGTMFGYELEVSRGRFDDGLLLTDEPVAVTVLKGRRSRRVEVSEVEATLTEASGHCIEGARVVNVGREGLLLELPANETVRPGSFVELRLRASREASLQIGALTVHGGAGRTGARVVPADARACSAWLAFVDPFLHPNTRRGQTWAAAMWRLYEQSGYFELSDKRPAHFLPLREAFSVASRRLDSAPELGAQVTWPSGRGVEAALSLLQVYSGTSILYQVARRKDGPPVAASRQMLRAINLRALEPLLEQRDHRWLLVFVQQDGARWSRLAYRDFGLALPAAAGACVIPFRAVELGGGRTTPPRAGTELSEATAADRASLVMRIHALRDRPYADCLDLSEDQLPLEQVAERWQRHGFQRHRRILIARRGHACAAAVMEAADRGLHLFGLLDSVRLYPLTPGGAALHGELLEAAREHFAALGRERFVYFAEEEQARAPLPVAARDLGMAHLIALPAQVLPDLLEHLALVTAPRPSEVVHG